MLDYGQFCYLDVQKSGSTFVEAFLRKNCAVPLRAYKKHGRILWDTPDDGPECFYFISARDPVAQWRSLYFYGCEGKGALFRRLRGHHRVLDHYDATEKGLNRWLEVVLSPGFHDKLGEGYRARQAALYGYQTHRFLMLSFRRPRQVVTSFNSPDDVRRAYRTRRLFDTIIHNETLNEDLKRLVDGPLAPFLRNPATAAHDLEFGRRINASKASGAARRIDVSPTLRQEIEAREWLFYEALGYRRARPATPATPATAQAARLTG